MERSRLVWEGYFYAICSHSSSQNRKMSVRSRLNISAASLCTQPEPLYGYISARSVTARKTRVKNYYADTSRFLFQCISALRFMLTHELFVLSLRRKLHSGNFTKGCNTLVGLDDTIPRLSHFWKTEKNTHRRLTLCKSNTPVISITVT